MKQVLLLKGIQMTRNQEHSPQHAAKDFDIDDPCLPDWISETALTADDYPYDSRLKRKIYEADLEALQIELAKLQVHALATGTRIVALFEGRDSAGKGSCIKRFMEYLNPRFARIVALDKPNETEKGQWYFQRYVSRFPTSGEVDTVDEITGIYDKGKGAVIASKTVATLVEDGQPLYETTGNTNPLNNNRLRSHSTQNPMRNVTF